MATSYRQWIVWIVSLISFVSGAIIDTRTIQSVHNTSYDYIILGGGTAGLVVASRLSEDPETTVLVVEAGDFERTNPNVTDPSGLGIGKNTRVDWNYDTAPQIYGGNESIVYSAGKGLGGSSLINDLWPSLGLELDWNKIFTYSKQSENFHAPPPNLTALGASYEADDHGFSGLLSTCFSNHITPGDTHEIFNTTMKKFGIQPRHEFNGGDLNGFGVQQVTQDPVADIREDAARAYYYPFMNRKNLVAMVNTTATRIIWGQDSSDGSAVASAAEISSSTGEISTIQANKEIILSAGALRSPAILEHSGVGNPSILSRQSIDAKINLPSVGENLQDQTTMATLASNANNVTIPGLPAFVAFVSLEDLFGSNTSSLYNNTLSKIPSYASTIAAQNGGSSSATVQERLLKSQLDLLFRSNTPTSEIVPAAIQSFTAVVFWPLQPFSRGSVHIQSPNATLQPKIDPKFFQFDFDTQVAVATAKFSRRFLTTSPVVDTIDLSTLSPSFEDIPEDADDEVWADWVKNKSNYQPNYHHLGTCAMLPRELGGVVDNEFRVYGTKNVRVVDLSVIPLQVAGHSTSLLYGVAEWAAEKIRGAV
ncbi:MAG: hypothetical protein M1820_001246 [Bogoriella megaspora]|nr:MAG: hypothetical protein M1820_001246 [Bogoriella megaspora]